MPGKVSLGSLSMQHEQQKSNNCFVQQSAEYLQVSIREDNIHLKQNVQSGIIIQIDCLM